MEKYALKNALYEISISIGNSFDLKRMLNDVTHSIFIQLRLSAVFVYQNTSTGLQLISSQAEAIEENSNYLEGITQLQKSFDDSKSDWIELQFENSYHYLFELKDFGQILLSKSTEPLEPQVIDSLKKPILKLSNAIRASLEFEELTSFNAKLLESQSMAKIGSWELNIEKDQLWWSDEVFNIFEIDATKFRASYDAFLELIHPDDREAVQQAYAKSLADKQPYQVEHRLLFSDGRVKYVYEHAILEFNEQGNPVRSVGTVQDVTDTKLVKMLSEQQEKELNTIIESLPLTLFVKEAKELRFVRFNSAGEKLLGYRRDQLIGKNDYDFFSKEQADFFTHVDRETLESGEEHVIHQEEIDTPSGKRLLHTIKTPILDDSGEPKYLLGISEDITELKEAEAKLKKSEEYLTYAQSVAKIGHYVVDGKTGIWESSKELDCIFGIDSDIKKNFETWINFIHPEDLPSVQNYIQNMQIEQIEFKDISYRIINQKNRQIIWVHDVGRVTYDDDGQFVEMFGTAQDITERKRTELALENSEKKLAELYNAIDDSIFLLEVTEQGPGKFIEVNDVACQRLGYSREQLLQMSPMDIDASGKENSSMLEQHIKDLVEHPNNDFETVHVTKEGRQFPVEIRVRVIGYQGKEVLMAVVRDISERKQNEASLQLSSIVIENLVEGIMVCDQDVNLISINPAFTKITGYTFDEIKGKSPNVLKSGRHDENFYLEMWHAVTTSGFWQGEIWNRRYNGEVYPEWLSISSIRNQKGEVINYIGVFSDISSIKENEAELRFLAHHDPLTKLPNRVLLNDRIKHALDQSKRSNSQVAVLYLDLDRFKAINDSFGHPHGDLLLQTVAERLTTALRDEDTVSRVSGDEFVILLEGLKSADEAGIVAQKILNSLGEPVMLEHHEVTVTASIGIAMGLEDGNEAVQLLKNADIALYRAKDMGRNSYEYFSSDMSSSSFEALFILNGLHKALDNNEFVVYYQPQINMLTNHLIGVEALIRWQHPELGLVPPGKFIPLAEDSGVIIKLGEWVLRESCFQMKRWLAQELPVSYIAVNLSGRQLLDKKLIETVKRALNDSGLEGRYIELEVTETVVMKEESYADVLNQLKELGVRISIDDFGTGYSSLVRLKHLPIDKLKIDMSFIKGIPRDEEDCNITHTIINLARSMNLEVLAEGVETQEQADFLVNRECIFSQGYLYSPPVPVVQFQNWLQQRKG